jgi:hypothetical protein
VNVNAKFSPTLLRIFSALQYFLHRSRAFPVLTLQISIWVCILHTLLKNITSNLVKALITVLYKIYGKSHITVVHFENTLLVFSSTYSYTDPNARTQIMNFVWIQYEKWIYKLICKELRSFFHPILHKPWVLQYGPTTLKLLVYGTLTVYSKLYTKHCL